MEERFIGRAHRTRHPRRALTRPGTGRPYHPRDARLPLTSQPDRRRTWPRRLAAGVALAVLATSCGGWAVLDGLGSIDRVDAFSSDQARPADDGSTTFLVVGTDERDGIPEKTLKDVLHAGASPATAPTP
ncbi:hypothetical protein ACFQ0M_20215 [Kitasatospora aburaviensis]